MSDATTPPTRDTYTPDIPLQDNDVDACALGGNIRSTRILRGLKLRELAEQVGCSESMVSKIENGKTTPSLGLPHKIAQSFDTTVPALLSPRDDSHIVSRAGERIRIQIDRFGSHVERLVAADGKHTLEGHLHILAPGGGSEGVTRPAPCPSPAETQPAPATRLRAPSRLCYRGLTNAPNFPRPGSSFPGGWACRTSTPA